MAPGACRACSSVPSCEDTLLGPPTELVLPVAVADAEAAWASDGAVHAVESAAAACTNATVRTGARTFLDVFTLPIPYSVSREASVAAKETASFCLAKATHQ